MNRSQYQNEDFSIEFIAHEAQGERLLLVRMTGAEGEVTEEETPLKVALVLDRSGSMGGRKLTIAREAAARFVSALGSRDRIAAVVYDDEVDVLFGLSAPSQELADRVAATQSGGSTNLCGGWKTGVDLVGENGYVILLSDGLANVGQWTDAASLGRLARQARLQKRVQTTTIGVGTDYDERLMAAMAKEGGGGHYFAHTAEAILDAFAHERFAISAISALDVQIEVAGSSQSIGSVFAGEVRTVVLPIHDNSEEVKISFRLPNEEDTWTITLPMPTSFTEDHEVTAEKLAVDASELMDKVLEVTSPNIAREVADSLRQLILRCLAHPLADGALLKGVVLQLKDAQARAEQLAIDWSFEAAVILRKRGAQMRSSLSKERIAFSSFSEDQDMVSTMRSATKTHSARPISKEALAIRPAAYWLGHNVVPLRMQRGLLTIAITDPKDVFVADDIAKELGIRVRVSNKLASQQEQQELLALSKE